MLNAVDWIVSLLTGALATTVATLAVASIGFMLLAGHIRIARTARIILGCFILVGAPIIASGLINAIGPAAEQKLAADAMARPPEFETPDEPDGAYKPYPGAAVGLQPNREEAILER